MKLLQFTDFHLRLTPAPVSQFHVQPLWRGESRELFSRIAKLATDVDAIAFTGDAAHGGGPKELATFFDLLAEVAGDKPVFIVAGNHDAIHPQWKDYFWRGCEKYRNMCFEDGVYASGQIDIALINNEYLTSTGVISTSWPEPFFPIPAMSDSCVERLNTALSTTSTRPAIALIHCPTHMVPPVMIDLDGRGVLSGMERYRDTLHGVLDRHPRVKSVLSGHVHFNSSMIAGNGRTQHSLASIAEYPYQVRIVEMDAFSCLSRIAALASDIDVESLTHFT
jgi:3',5'-cyclic AMP phosphodiesterase CpdA